MVNATTRYVKTIGPLVNSPEVQGPNRYGTAVCTAVIGGLEDIGGVLADSLVGDAGRWVAPNAQWSRVAVGRWASSYFSGAMTSRCRGCSGGSHS